MNTEYQCSEARFLGDAAKHGMTILRDDGGVNRHIRFKRQGDSAYWFDVVTWPGVLCINGDMGTFVFSRLNDMFKFFRKDMEFNKHDGQSCLAINPGYWSEKLQAPRPKEAQEYSAESFQQHVKTAFDNWKEANQPDEDADAAECEKFDAQASELWQELEADVLSIAGDGSIRAYDAAQEFNPTGSDTDFDLSECWEWDCTQYTFHFIWCCYAIAWAIEAYDAAKAAEKPTVAPELATEGGAA